MPSSRTINARLLAAAALTFAALALPPISALAASRTSLVSEHRHAEDQSRIQSALDQLNLSSAQKAKIKPIAAHAKHQLQAVKTDQSLNTEAKKAKAKEITMTTIMQVMPILTPAQQDKLMDMVQKARAKMHGQKM